MTVFDQEYVEQIGRDLAAHLFPITFRTITVAQLAGRLERSGFRIDSVLGDYHGRAWSPDADVWVVVARRG